MGKHIRICFLALCALCVVIGISGCTTKQTPEESFAQKWGFGGVLHTDDVIPNEETAISVATAIFGNIQKTSSYYSDHVFEHVSYHTENEAWIVTFSQKSAEGTVILGGGCTIILRKSDGCVLGIVSGE